MSRTTLLQRASRRLKGLSEERLRMADGYLAYLEEEHATEELLRIPGFAEAFEEAERDIAAGRLTPAEHLRQKY
ncbi:MAG TPA: hypothetical protein VNE39_17095 [Planctomycetota bacterium]|nr:hypothetical protein [Planctomycetota bacterium]